MSKVKQGLPSSKKALSLLNSAYDNWGDEKLFDWKYKKYPNFNEEEVFFVEDDQENLASFGRVFSKEIISDYFKENVYILGDAAVHPGHQGEGLYTAIHEARTEYSKSKDSPLVFSFIRKTNIPFKVNKKRGWGHRELPLHMLMLSPAKVVKEYGELALEDETLLKKICEVLGKRIQLNFSDENLNLSELVEQNQRKKKLKLSINFSDSAVSKIIEQINDDIEFLDLFSDSIGLLSDGDVSFGSDESEGFNIEKKDFEDISLERKETLSDEDIQEILSTYSSHLDGYDLRFRREKIDVEHLLEYPYITDILLVKIHDEIVGFAVLGNNKSSNLDEIWVLEWLWGDEKVKNVLLNEIENIGVNRDLDTVIIISDDKLNEKWTSIGYQTIMWNIFESNRNIEKILKNGGWRINLYDVV